MRVTTRQIVMVGLLGALVVVLGLAPVGGFIPVPTPAGRATTMHIPVILAGTLEGPVVGALVGFLFGLFSYIRNLMGPANPVAAVMFADPLVTFLPRILIGIVAHYAFRLVKWPYTRAGVAAVTGLLVADMSRRAGLLYGRGSALVTTEGAASPGLWLLAVLAGVGIAAGAWFVLSGRNAGVGAAGLLGTLTNTVGVLGLATLRGYLPAQVSLTVGLLHGLPEMLVAVVLVTLLDRSIRRATQGA